MHYNFLRFPGGKLKAFTMSFDDGSDADKKVIEVANKYGLKATFNVIGKNFITPNSGINKAYAEKYIFPYGHEIANHGYSHKALDRISHIEGIREILEGRLAIEKELGMIIKGMAYADKALNRFKNPDIYKDVKDYLEDLGIAYVRSAGEDNDRFELPEDWFCWMPSVHQTNPELMQYLDKFIELDESKLWNAIRHPRLCYLWGHSTEFDFLGWDMPEKIFSKIANHDDIWYATNIEIYNYVKAYNSLIYSADSKIVYNPTLYEIWFEIDGTTYQIKPGETLTLDLKD